MSGIEKDSKVFSRSRCQCGCGCKKESRSSFSSLCPECMVGACGDSDPCTCYKCGFKGINAEMKYSRSACGHSVLVCDPGCKADLEAAAKEAAEDEAEYQRQAAKDRAREAAWVVQQLASNRPRVAAAKVVAANWRLQKRLPYLTDLARRLGLSISREYPVTVRDGW